MELPIIPEKYKCKCRLNLCEISVDCAGKAKININQNAPAEGEYTLKMKYLNSFTFHKKTFATGDKLEFEQYVNENYCYEIQIQFNNQTQTFNVGGKIVDTFTFCTIPQV